MFKVNNKCSHCGEFIVNFELFHLFLVLQLLLKVMFASVALLTHVSFYYFEAVCSKIRQPI